MTFFEVLAVLACLLIFAALLVSKYVEQNRWANRARQINCASNLKQVNLAFKICEGDNNNRYPIAVSVTNGGGMELFKAGNVGAYLQVVSNEVGTTKLFLCPADETDTYATNWNDLDHSHISYFFGADATNESNSDMVFDGDDNLIIGGTPVQSGLLNISRTHQLSGPKRGISTSATLVSLTDALYKSLQMAWSRRFREPGW